VWRVPSLKLRSVILYFAASVIFSVVAVELLLDIVQHCASCEVVLRLRPERVHYAGTALFSQRLEKLGGRQRR
jgi:ZIP family zinc transporter